MTFEEKIKHLLVHEPDATIADVYDRRPKLLPDRIGNRYSDFEIKELLIKQRARDFERQLVVV